MFVYGVRGSQLPQEADMREEELEVFGVDWEALYDNNLLQSQEANNPTNEESGSWLGRVGPPEHLNEVPVYAPDSIFTVQEIEELQRILMQLDGMIVDFNQSHSWIYALAFARRQYPNEF